MELFKYYKQRIAPTS